MNFLQSMLGLAPPPARPRSARITMVLDKHFGLHAAQDLVDTAAPYIDTIKLGWGSCALYPEALLRQKIRIYRDAGIHVCPGGTFVETLFEKTQLPQSFALLRDLGFNAIEVSNGIHPRMTRQDKLRSIELAVGMGFHTTSEVGKKLPEEDRALSPAQRVAEIRDDLAAGAAKVTMEARESGTVGIFDAQGRIQAELAHELFRQVDPQQIIWEAPQRTQQLWLLQQLGSDVNIGNVAPADVLSLESMRCGLRADTFRDHCRDARHVYLELGVGGALRAARRGDVVVVVDALRASATIVQCLERGAREVVPVSEAQGLQGEVTIGERGGHKLPNADLGNSPREVTAERVAGRSVVISTTNGTECIRSAKSETSVVLIGTTTNCNAVAAAAVELAQRRGAGISLVAAGRNNLPAIEDRAAVTEIMKAIGNVTPRGTLEPCFSDALEGLFLASESGIHMCSLGYGEDVLFCARMNIATAVPLFDGQRIVRHLPGGLA